MQKNDKDDLVQIVTKSRSMCILASWSLTAINIGSNPPKDEKLKMELLEGLTFTLEAATDQLAYVEGILIENSA